MRKRQTITIKYSVFQDERLSYKARGIMAYLLSHSKNWKCQLYDLENNSIKDGKASLRTALKELTDCGYLRKEFNQRKKGKFTGSFYNFTNIPFKFEEKKPKSRSKSSKSPYKHPKWIKLRNYIVDRDNYKCTNCGTDERLDVHHLSYEGKKNIWDVSPSNLITLCRPCHEATHGRKFN